MAPPSRPDLYLLWPGSAVGQLSGGDSPAWEIYRTARQMLAGGLNLGLVVEELVHGITSEKPLKLRGRGMATSGDPTPQPPPLYRGMLFTD